MNKKNPPTDTITKEHSILTRALKYKPSGVIITVALLSAYTLQCVVNLAIFSCLYSLNKAIVFVNKNGEEQIKQMKEFKDFSLRSSKDRAGIRNILEKHIEEDK